MEKQTDKNKKNIREEETVCNKPTDHQFEFLYTSRRNGKYKNHYQCVKCGYMLET